MELFNIFSDHTLTQILVSSFGYGILIYWIIANIIQLIRGDLDGIFKKNRKNIKNVLAFMILISITMSCVENKPSRRIHNSNKYQSGVKTQRDVVHTVRTISNSNELETYDIHYNSDSTWINFVCFDNHDHLIPSTAIRDIKSE